MYIIYFHKPLIISSITIYVVHRSGFRFQPFVPNFAAETIIQLINPIKKQK